MAPRRTSTGSSPGALVYAAIDGTPAGDSATFGALLERHRGWRNLFTARLEPAPPTPPEPLRLVDDQHPFLPVYTFAAKGRQIPVVCPGGLSGFGLDTFWKNHNDTLQVQSRPPVMGRHAAAERSSALMNDFILNPELRYTVDDSGQTKYHIADRSLPNPGTLDAQAQLLYVSSHGFLGGFMMGNRLAPSTAAQPRAAQRPYISRPYFVVGKAAAQGRGFHGPLWIVLAQCSTLNSATWPLWARILAKSSPGVRGILAYEEASPSAAPAARLAEEFFAKLSEMPLLDAWMAVHAERGIRWAAIVHKKARYDRLKDFPAFQPLREVSTTATSASYFGYLRTQPEGEPILDRPEPFGLRLVHIHNGSEFEILPETLDSDHADLLKPEEDDFRVTVSAPPGDDIERVRLTLVYVRTSYKEQFTWGRVFGRFGSETGVEVDGVQTRHLTVSQKRPKPDISFYLGPQSRPPLHRDHSYVWLRVRAHLSSGAVLDHDFKTKGFTF